MALFWRLFALATLLLCFSGISSLHAEEQSSPREGSSECAPWINQSAVLNTKGLEVEYYNIRGSTKAELRAQMNRLGPKSSDRTRFDAYTAWHVRWDWPIDRNRPVFAETIVTFSIKTTLPCWSNSEGADPALQADWAQSLTGLSKHEMHHVEITTNEVSKIANAIKSAAKADPFLTAEQANKMGHEILSKIKSANSEYDIRTHHGRTEGIRFP